MYLTLDQLFLTPSGASTEVMLVFEDLAGARTRERLLFPSRDPGEVIRRLAAHLARRGDVGDVAAVRLRRSVGGELRDDPKLVRLLFAAFERALDR